MTPAPATWKDYRCEVCGFVSSCVTNHTGRVWNYCRGCSWKGVAFGEALRILGAIHRPHVFAGKGES